MDLLSQRVQALEDREAIREVVAMYSLHILNNETSKVPDLFADEGVFRIESANLRIAGREALIAFFNRMTPGTTFPFAQTTAIFLEEDIARHIGVLDNPSYTENRKGYQGIYNYTLRRVGGRWLFTDRSFVFLQGDPLRAIRKD
jgi:hypothetical protein